MTKRNKLEEIRQLHLAEEIRTAISVFQEVSREKYGDHSYASGYLGAMLSEVMFRYVEKETRDFLLARMANNVEEMRSELRKEG